MVASTSTCDFPWQEKLVAPLDATLKNVAKGTGIGKAKDETTLQSKINKRNGLCPNTYLRSTLLGTFKARCCLKPQ